MNTRLQPVQCENAVSVLGKLEKKFQVVSENWETAKQVVDKADQISRIDGD